MGGQEVMDPWHWGSVISLEQDSVLIVQLAQHSSPTVPGSSYSIWTGDDRSSISIWTEGDGLSVLGFPGQDSVLEDLGQDTGYRTGLCSTLVDTVSFSFSTSLPWYILAMCGKTSRLCPGPDNISSSGSGL